MHFLSEEQELVRNTARKFAEKHLKPGVIERDENAEFPSEQVKMMGELGFMGIMVPEKWNGAGMDTISYTLIIEELSRVDASAGVIVSVNNSLVCQIIVNYGNDWQKETYLKKLAGGQQLGAFSLSEPQSGSDASNLHTVAEKSGQYYILNGTKNWVTSGINSDVVIVMALTDKSAGYNGISTFIAPKDLDGFSVGQKEDKLGIRGSDTCELYFDNCRVPIENLIDKEGQGFRIALATLDGGRIGIAAQALGIAQAALDKSVQYAKERKQFGKPIIDFQAVQLKLAEMAMKVEASRLLIHRAAQNAAEGLPSIFESSVGKCFSNEMAREVTGTAIQLMGGYGYNKEYQMERRFRDAWGWGIAGGTIDIQKINIASALVGRRFNQRN